MNNMQNSQPEQLLTDLTPAQAEIISAAARSEAMASYGYAVSDIDLSPTSFTANVYVKDKAKDGYPVYAKFQTQAWDETLSEIPILTTPTERLDLKGANGTGTLHKGLRWSSNKFIKRVRVAIFRKNPGRDLFVAGNWVDQLF
jgi:hypothetical protein